MVKRWCSPFFIHTVTAPSPRPESAPNSFRPPVDDRSLNSYYGATTASELVASNAPATTTQPAPATAAEETPRTSPQDSGTADGAGHDSSTGSPSVNASNDSSRTNGTDSSAGSVLVYGNLEIRPDEIQVLADGRRVGLTVREFQVLCVLAQREDRVVRRADIYNQVWGGEMKHRDRSVDVFVRKVRNKLSHVAPHWSYIHTHFGVGYRFAPTPNEKDVVPGQPVEAPDLAAEPLAAS
jgi:DNA-binding winged helix-turn-helix (wHTH) protein